MSTSRLRLPMLVLLALGLGAFAWNDGQQTAGSETAEAMDLPVGARRLGSVDLNSAQTEQLIPDAGRGAAPRQAGVKGSPNPLARLQKERLQQTLARPLFSPSRRPPPVVVKRRRPAKVPLQAKKPARMDLALVGILSADADAIAILQHKKASRSYSVRVGQMVDGWRVKKITKSGVVLVGKSSLHVLPLFKNSTL